MPSFFLIRLAYFDTVGGKILLEPLGAAGLPGPCMGSLYLRLKTPFFSCSFRGRAFEPLIVAACRHLKETAHAAYGVCEPHFPYDHVPRCDSFAKYAAAFFNGSRSILTSASSLLALASSASTSVRGFLFLPIPGNLPSLYALTQLLTVYWGISSLRPTSVMLKPSSVTSFTASSRSSLE